MIVVGVVLAEMVVVVLIYIMVVGPGRRVDVDGFRLEGLSSSRGQRGLARAVVVVLAGLAAAVSR